ncbi:hypothetical protein D8B23_19730 [Verminephrobacter aporrectodeae subsp. tuberculatae]|uniref:Uncharacterized protein n=1 Tax=Verminephrobacter aporrectodeae subsp. tuberculatae TaxID=1110392 RepID=A0ABT3KS03_9BURK|nr:hypothetical protein [Verminephrobacter aporrectodeae subsp. tuberculatae]MCW8200571.1 hypothetical protein [Verminephrobacter aporrectodeae subsp. tuberculatae]
MSNYVAFKSIEYFILNGFWHDAIEMVKKILGQSVFSKKIMTAKFAHYSILLHFSTNHTI